MDILGQASEGDAAAIVMFVLLAWFGLAAIPSLIAGNKGYSAVGYYFFGLFFFLPALIVALVIPEKQVRSPQSPAAPQARRDSSNAFASALLPANPQRQSAQVSATRSPAIPHQPKWSPSRWMYECEAAGCDYASSSIEEFSKVHLPGQRSLSAPARNVTTPPAVAAESETAQLDEAEPEFKLCPDCAEEIRWAARKCRFCNYRFATDPSPSAI